MTQFIIDNKNNDLLIFFNLVNNFNIVSRNFDLDVNLINKTQSVFIPIVLVNPIRFEFNTLENRLTPLPSTLPLTNNVQNFAKQSSQQPDITLNNRVTSPPIQQIIKNQSKVKNDKLPLIDKVENLPIQQIVKNQSKVKNDKLPLTDKVENLPNKQAVKNQSKVKNDKLPLTDKVKNLPSKQTVNNQSKVKNDKLPLTDKVENLPSKQTVKNEKTLKKGNGLGNNPLLKNLINKLFSFLNSVKDNPMAIKAYHKLKQSLLKEVKHSSTLSDLKEIFTQLALSTDKPESKYAIRLLSQLQANKKELPEEFQLILGEVLSYLSESTKRAYNKVGPSQNRGEALRTPTEVLIDLLSYLKSAPRYFYLEQDLKSLLLTHKTSISEVKNYLKNLEARFPNTKVAAKSKALRAQLIDTFIPTRFQDNIYGRAFDSAFVSQLVKNPPQEVQQAMSLTSQGLANYLKTLPLTSKQHTAVSKGIQELLTVKDPRFWFPAVPELQKLKDPDQDALTGLIKYLEAPKKTGHECISIPYLMVKVSLVLKENGFSPPWLVKADLNYQQHLHPQVEGIRINRNANDSLNTQGAGITLQHQPSISYEEWMTPSQRPTTVRRPNFNSQRANLSAKQSLENSLQKGLPWASGMSGSTNISLYAWDHFNKQTPIDPKASLLGALMFLVYDGGHSIHEPLWAASQINNQLNLGFDLGGTGQIENFISDYEKFNNMYTGNLKNSISQAFENSFNKVTDYYKKHSFYANKT